MKRHLKILVAAIAIAILPAAEAAAQSYSADIRRDTNGIPHILAQDFGGMGYGYGYAFAQDNICTIAESYVTVRGERSRYFGPNGSYQQRGNGFSANNLNSDFFYTRIIDDGTIEDLLAQPPPNGPVSGIRQGVRGYVAGYNRYLADTGVANLPDPRCRGASWVKPINEIDAYRRFYQLSLLASQTVAIDGIATAQPPPIDSGASPGDDPGFNTQAKAEDLAEAMKNFPLGGIGSNGVGLGSEATDNGKGMLLANPHFPWDGSERFYQSHLTIPGVVNVSGGSLFGVPIVLIGHNENLAWTHTVSTAYRFTPFEEIINPLNTTQYLYDGQFRDMDEDKVTVQVLTDDGTLEDRTRTLYSTHHGPIISSLSGVPLPWLPVIAFTMGDVNAGNFRHLNHWFEANQAQSVGRLDEIERTYQGIPWVNTIAADSSGKAYYADIGAIPHVTDEKTLLCNTPLGIVTSALLRLPILNGATSACEWGTDPDSVAPGIFGPSNEPSHIRDDYTSNMNDSYWLSNPEAPLEGFDRIIGDERAPRALRTRLGLKIIEQRLDGSDGLPGNRFSRQQLQDAVFNNRQYAGEIWRDPLVTLCRTAPLGFLIGSTGPVEVGSACPVLENWDLHDNLDSRGALLFRRFATRALANLLPVPLPLPTGDPLVFGGLFNPSDPVNTPAGLNILSPKIILAFADAVSDLRGAGIPLDAPLRDWQYERRGDEKIPIHGGPGTAGVFNAINVNWVKDGAEPGYPNVPHGSSFVMVTQFTNGCPDDRSILTYSQSENPNSPYNANQTRMFSRKQWVNPAFCEAEVLAEPGLTITRICSSGPCPSREAAAPPAPAAKPKRKCKKLKSKRKRKQCAKKRRKNKKNKNKKKK